MPREDQNSYEAHLSVKKLFVAGLRDGIDENALREYFNRFGTVTEVLVMKDREGKFRTNRKTSRTFSIIFLRKTSWFCFCFV